MGKAFTRLRQKLAKWQMLKFLLMMMKNLFLHYLSMRQSSKQGSQVFLFGVFIISKKVSARLIMKRALCIFIKINVVVKHNYVVFKHLISERSESYLGVIMLGGAHHQNFFYTIFGQKLVKKFKFLLYVTSNNISFSNNNNFNKI